MTKLYYEDIEVDSRMESPWVTVRAEEIVAFAEVWDPHPFHLDEEDETDFKDTDHCAHCNVECQPMDITVRFEICHKQVHKDCYEMHMECQHDGCPRPREADPEEGTEEARPTSLERGRRIG